MLNGDWSLNKDERFKFYENLYFREIDRIEKVSARLSLPFAALLAVATILAFMLNAKLKPSIEPWHQIFWVSFLFSSASLLLGAWFLKMAWFGHLDKLLPTADSIEGYYWELERTYAEYENSTELAENNFREFLYQDYIRFASENAINNDKRSYNIYRALVAFTVAILLALMAAIPFYLGAEQSKEIINVEQQATTTTSTSTSEERQGQYSKAREPSKPSTAVETEEVSPNNKIQPTGKRGS